MRLGQIKYSEAKERASAFALNGPGETSTTIDYNQITGSNTSERIKQMGQDMTKSFKSNWLDFSTPTGFKGVDPEGI